MSFYNYHIDPDYQSMINSQNQSFYSYNNENNKDYLYNRQQTLINNINFNISHTHLSCNKSLKDHSLKIRSIKPKDLEQVKTIYEFEKTSDSIADHYLDEEFTYMSETVKGMTRYEDNVYFTILKNKTTKKIEAIMNWNFNIQSDPNIESDSHIEISMIAVDKDSRKKGYATLLISFLKECAMGSDLKKIKVEGTTPAANFYFKNGFIPDFYQFTGSTDTRLNAYAWKQLSPAEQLELFNNNRDDNMTFRIDH